jgi:hypothetical protein
VPNVCEMVHGSSSDREPSLAAEQP